MNEPKASLNRRAFAALAGSLATFVACACRRAQAQQPAEQGAPLAGGAMSAKSHFLELGANVLQDKGPVDDINMYLNGFHFYADDMGRQI